MPEDDELASCESRELSEFQKCDSAAWVLCSALSVRWDECGRVGKVSYGDMLAHQRDALWRMKADLRDMVHEIGVDATLTGRIKSFGSICRKMKARGISHRDVWDAVGVRVIVVRIDDCYRLVERIERRYEPICGRQRDYIASPKDNGYQSLHTTVRDDQRVAVEIQLRTRNMHARSECGPAAHGLYELAQESCVLA
jgi:GTP diphosphokinase / guanosine-3',5'-bis(diphosphate) 3'-diphosphatase